jgi:myosin tail region-interacting protein MTI1
MPAPAMPRRAGPPRKKATPKTTAQSPPPATESEVPASLPIASELSAESEDAPKEASEVKAPVPEDGTDSKVEDEEKPKEIAPPPAQEDLDVPKADTRPTQAVPVERAASPEVVEVPTEKATDVEEEEDEEARRKRVAERIARMGGVNPLAAPPRRDSSSSVPPTSPPMAPAVPAIDQLPPLPKSPSPVPEAEHPSLHAFVESKEKERSPSPLPVHKQEHLEKPSGLPDQEQAKEESEDELGKASKSLVEDKDAAKAEPAQDGKF